MVKILVATSFSQGVRNTDFSTTFEGELVYLGEECYTYSSECFLSYSFLCLCGIYFIGFSSGNPTTTALVVDLPINISDYVQALSVGLTRFGYDSSLAGGLANFLIYLLDFWNVDSVLERFGGDLFCRSVIF